MATLRRLCVQKVSISKWVSCWNGWNKLDTERTGPWHYWIKYLLEMGHWNTTWGGLQREKNTHTHKEQIPCRNQELSFHIPEKHPKYYLERYTKITFPSLKSHALFVGSIRYPKKLQEVRRLIHVPFDSTWLTDVIIGLTAWFIHRIT